MFGKLLKKKVQPSSTVVIARLNDRTQPLDRGDLYEDPLTEVLGRLGVGEVTGGGTQLGPDFEIQYCDIEIRLHGPAAEAIAAVKDALEHFGAPKGSKLIFEPPSGELEFGVNEGLAVYLNGTDLPPAVYKDCDVNFVYTEFSRLLGANGAVHSHWQGPTETALYMYGPSFAAMRQSLLSFLEFYPLCRGARVVQIA